MAAAVLVGLFPVLSGSTTSWVVLAVLGAVAVRSRVPEYRDVVVLASCLYVLALVPGVSLWPLPAGAALLLTAALAAARGGWSRWRTWWRVGRIDAVSWALVGGVVVVTVVALLTWHHVVDRRLPAPYVELAEGRPPWLVAGAGVGFLLLNSFIEDSIFSGLLLGLLDRFLPPRASVAVVAICFGLLHLHGVPDGWVGVAMSGTWAVLLAVLRHRTGGLVATYLAHAAADATIVAMLLPSVGH
ncbi:CPBP family intramembrane glutamic endopeptidase [Kineococcus sp. NPDC059986]|uniref:CPBP family intramembrane glutamic endopeptidase n=1 Tax=Kineococcus sp. NPDC059986 TaxID=3155538 RepID=UPI003450B991